MYIVENMQDLDNLLQERCEHEWEAESDEDEDKIIINAKGKWFDNNILTPLVIYKGCSDWKIETQIEKQDVQKIKNTISYIQDNFDRIYQAMLEALLPFLIRWEMENMETHEKVMTIQDLHHARDGEVKNETEVGCIAAIQLNCQHEREDMVFYSMIFMPDIYKYGYDDGFEVVFFKDKVVYFTDGNTREAIFDFDLYEGRDTYFGI